MGASKPVQLPRSIVQSGHLLIHFDRFGELRVIQVVDLGHVSFPVVFPGESFAASSGKVASWNRTVKLLLLLMSVIDVALKMRFGAKAFAAVWI